MAAKSSLEGGAYDDWMSHLHPSLHVVSFTSLAIPGSHDSFAFHLDKSRIGPDIKDSAFGKLAKGIVSKPVKKIIWNWSITQTMNFEEQLHAGIRYFDLRLAFNGELRKDSNPDVGSGSKAHGYKPSRLQFVHGLFGIKVKDALKQIKTFLDQEKYRKEVVILHLQHFYNFDKECHKICQSLIADVFGAKLCPRSKDPCDYNLDKLWSGDYQVICVYCANIQHEHKQALWPKHSIHSPWPNVTSPTQLIQKLESNCDKAKDKSKFQVAQAILSPNAGMIGKHVTSTLKAQCAKRAAKHVTDWIQKKDIEGHGSNIFIADFVEMENFIPTVIGLNRKI